jgi:hypothetical protein
MANNIGLGNFASPNPYITYVDYNGGTNPVYVGNAAPSTATSISAWQIKYITYDGNSNPLTVTFASGSPNFAFVWDNRATYSYS